MNLFFAGFRGSYRPPAPPNHGLEDNRPDVHDEADCDIPDTQAVLERIMSNMSKLEDVEYQARVWLISQTTKTCSFAFCDITAAVGFCSSTNRCWKTWLGRVRLAQYNWIELEWNRPWLATEISAFPANRVWGIPLFEPWWAGQICICVIQWGSTYMKFLIICYVYIVYIPYKCIDIKVIYYVYGMYIP